MIGHIKRHVNKGETESRYIAGRLFNIFAFGSLTPCITCYNWTIWQILSLKVEGFLPGKLKRLGCWVCDAFPHSTYSHCPC